ncbi:helix-turn-helix transcriptional regulator [Ralstonia solanacearum]|uniref:helix-turn-helix transcriptional regulator n=1 Tax=Ralstonia solanacearum TaxID=305 RepID=UPI00129F7646|nr:LuxR C-terminal-related transcriptional regulator [Ralstonia solanacearum]AYB63418.1 helix-turn-helix transcriptional regulator [Ralstonia solanacearum]
MLTRALEQCRTAAERVHDIATFKTWTRESVRPILNHRHLACGYGRTTSSGVTMDYVVTVDYPNEHLLAIRNAAGGIDTPIMRRWLTTRRPVYFDAASPWEGTDPVWLEKFVKHDLRNCAADAVFDEANCVGTYFSFHALPTVEEGYLDVTLRGLTPALHGALLRAVASVEHDLQQASQALATLTEREREVALLIGQGRSNAEIAQVVCKSESTVKHYLSSIMDKTGCENRVCVAMLISRLLAAPLGIGTKVL